MASPWVNEDDDLRPASEKVLLEDIYRINKLLKEITNQDPYRAITILLASLASFGDAYKIDNYTMLMHDRMVRIIKYNPKMFEHLAADEKNRERE